MIRDKPNQNCIERDQKICKKEWCIYDDAECIKKVWLIILISVGMKIETDGLFDQIFSMKLLLTFRYQLVFNPMSFDFVTPTQV